MNENQHDISTAPLYIQHPKIGVFDDREFFHDEDIFSPQQCISPTNQMCDHTDHVVLPLYSLPSGWATIQNRNTLQYYSIELFQERLTWKIFIKEVDLRAGSRLLGVSSRQHTRRAGI